MNSSDIGTIVGASLIGLAIVYWIVIISLNDWATGWLDRHQKELCQVLADNGLTLKSIQAGSDSAPCAVQWYIDYIVPERRTVPDRDLLRYGVSGWKMYRLLRRHEGLEILVYLGRRYRRHYMKEQQKQITSLPLKPRH